MCDGNSPLVPLDKSTLLPIIRRNIRESLMNTINWAENNIKVCIHSSNLTEKEWPLPDEVETVKKEYQTEIYSDEFAKAAEALSKNVKFMKILEKVADFLNLPGGLSGTLTRLWR